MVFATPRKSSHSQTNIPKCTSQDHAPKIKMPHFLAPVFATPSKSTYTRSSQDHAPTIKMPHELPGTSHSAQWSLQRLATAPIPERTYPSAPARTMRPKSKCHANFLAPVTRHNGLGNASPKHPHPSVPARTMRATSICHTNLTSYSTVPQMLSSTASAFYSQTQVSHTVSITTQVTASRRDLPAQNPHVSSVQDIVVLHRSLQRQATAPYQSTSGSTTRLKSKCPLVHHSSQGLMTAHMPKLSRERRFHARLSTQSCLRLLSRPCESRGKQHLATSWRIHTRTP